MQVPKHKYDSVNANSRVPQFGGLIMQVKGVRGSQFLGIEQLKWLTLESRLAQRQMKAGGRDGGRMGGREEGKMGEGWKA